MDKRIQAILQEVTADNIEQRVRLVYNDGELMSTCKSSKDFARIHIGGNCIVFFQGVRYDDNGPYNYFEKFPGKCPVRLEILDSAGRVAAIIKDGLLSAQTDNYFVLNGFSVMADHLAALPKCDCGCEATYGINSDLHAFWCSKGNYVTR